jgi:hypothetical protein
LIQGETDPAQILWTAQGLQPINAVYDTSSAELVLTPGSPWLNSDIIEIKAILPGGAEVSGLVFAQVFPNDGSIGSESEDFTLALIPNVFQPEYIDIFLLNNLQSTRAPLLRLNDGSWSDLALEIRVTDRAGNRKTVLKNANGSGTPLAFALRQSTSIAPRLFSTCSKYAESPRSIQRTKT